MIVDCNNLSLMGGGSDEVETRNLNTYSHFDNRTRAKTVSTALKETVSINLGGSKYFN